ncbi:hypothetical protein HYX07_02570 [Candidatus Woesearchaeota archaeon]|nr:hypothetical protein [Candidatus Woesearchaeota archaeon]
MVTTVQNSIFDRIHHSVNMFNSLQNSRDTLVMNREAIDERLFDELDAFEEFMKRFESTFLEILKEDLRDISRAAVINTDNSEKAEEMIEGINNIIEGFSKMENECIARSQSLINLASQFRNELMAVKRDMETKVKSQKKHKKALNSALTGVPHANGG